jgi:hypothetical protein
MVRHPLGSAILPLRATVSACFAAPVCTSELGAAAKYHEDFTKRGVKLIALSCNTLDSHKGEGRQGARVGRQQQGATLLL